MDLHDRLHARPLDYMERTNADHAFVVIGRTKGSRIDGYKTWGKEAVVCDPWDNKAFASKEIPNKMYGGGGMGIRQIKHLSVLGSIDLA